MRAGKLAAVVIVAASALVGCQEEPPPDQPGRASGPPVFAYATSGKVRVARGEATVADLPIAAKDNVVDGEWTPDGARFLFSTNKKLVSVDAASGAAVEVNCTCGGIAVAGGTVYVLAEYNGKELAAYDAATLVPKGTLKPVQPNARGLLSVAGAGDRLVTFQITADGARPVTDVVVIDPATGAATKVGDSFDGGLVQSTAYTPRNWAGKPMFAYVGLATTGATHGVASVVLIDPVNPAQQIVGDKGHLRARAANVEDPSIDQTNLWWSWDGKLGVTARVWSCDTMGRSCTDHTPKTQWSFDGRGWAVVDERGLVSTRGLGGGTVELSGGNASGTGKQRITLVTGEHRKAVASDVTGLWTPPSPPPPPKSDGTVTVVNLNAAMGFKLGAGEDRGTNAKLEDLEKLADDILRQDGDIANLQEMAKPAAKEVAAILARRTGREWRLNWAGSGRTSYYRGEHENEPPVYDQVSSGNAQLVQIGDGVVAQRPLTVDTEPASDGEQDQGIKFGSGGRSFLGTEITTERHGVVDVYNTHLARAKDASDEARSKDVEQLQARTESRPHPVLLTGDFNLVIDGKGDDDSPRTVGAVNAYMNRLGYTDLGRDLGPTSNYQFPEYLVGRKRIDYILARGVATHGTARFTSHRSDHWGLVTRIGPG